MQAAMVKWTDFANISCPGNENVLDIQPWLNQKIKLCQLALKILQNIRNFCFILKPHIGFIHSREKVRDVLHHGLCNRQAVKCNYPKSNRIITTVECHSKEQSMASIGREKNNKKWEPEVCCLPLSNQIYTESKPWQCQGRALTHWNQSDPADLVSSFL